MSHSETPHHRKRPRRGPFRFLLICLLVTAGLYAGARCFFRAPEPVPETPPPAEQESTLPEHDPEAEAIRAHRARKEDCYTILVSGVDDDHGGSDVNILLSVNAGDGFIYGVSIPRDTKAVFHGKSHKINAAYNTGGMELLSQVVAEQLGIPVDYTVLVDLDGFVALVDALDGVDFEVPVDMDYDDPVQGLSIHFSRGLQHLNGTDAMKVVRFRHNNDGTGYGSEDLGRMQTQQKFLKAVAKKALSITSVKDIPAFAEIFQQSVKTDLTLGNMAWLGSEALSMGPENINFSTLPGEWRSPFIYLDPEETLSLVNACLNPYVEDRIPADLQIPS